MISYRFLLLPLLAFLFQACPPEPCDPDYVEYESLPDSIISLLPYNDGEVIRMQHSGGHVIEFSVQRKLEEITKCFDCDNCFEYQKVMVDLIPDYQITPIQINLSASSDGIYNLYFWFSNSSFYLQLNYPYEMLRKTVNAGRQIYPDTYALVKHNSNHGYGVASTLFADSLFYDYTYGIVKISMSNGESYVLYEE